MLVAGLLAAGVVGEAPLRIEENGCDIKGFTTRAFYDFLPFLPWNTEAEAVSDTLCISQIEGIEEVEFFEGDSCSVATTGFRCCRTLNVQIVSGTRCADLAKKDCPIGTETYQEPDVAPIGTETYQDPDGAGQLQATTEWCPPVCCEALIASCEACKADMTVEAFCEKKPGYRGCPKGAEKAPDPVSTDEFQGVEGMLFGSTAGVISSALVTVFV